MNVLRLAAVLLSLACAPAFAADPHASEASVRELIDVLQSKKMIEGFLAQMDANMKGSIDKATANQPLTPGQAAIMENMRSKIVALIRQNLKWETLQPVFLDIYEKSFTEKEVRGMLAFYKSPPGQAVIQKMPLVMQNTMQAMQGRMSVLTPQIEQLQRDAIAQIKAAPAK